MLSLSACANVQVSSPKTAAPSLLVSRAKDGYVVLLNDFDCIKINKNKNSNEVLFLLNSKAKDKFFETTKAEINQSLKITVCKSVPKEIRISAPINSGRLLVNDLTDSDIECLKENTYCN